MNFDNAKMFIQTNNGAEEFKGIESLDDLSASDKAVFEKAGVTADESKALFKTLREYTLTIPKMSALQNGDVIKKILNSTSTKMTIYAVKFVQTRTHKKKRINKKWAKQYGYKTLYVPHEIKNIREIARDGVFAKYEAQF